MVTLTKCRRAFIKILCRIWAPGWGPAPTEEEMDKFIHDFFSTHRRFFIPHIPPYYPTTIRQEWDALLNLGCDLETWWNDFVKSGDKREVPIKHKGGMHHGKKIIKVPHTFSVRCFSRLQRNTEAEIEYLESIQDVWKKLQVPVSRILPKMYTAIFFKNPNNFHIGPNKDYYIDDDYYIRKLEPSESIEPHP